MSSLIELEESVTESYAIARFPKIFVLHPGNYVLTLINHMFRMITRCNCLSKHH